MIKNETPILFSLILALAISAAMHSTAFAQSGLDDLTAAFKAYRANHYSEKMYLRTDRGLYLTGETVWFKIYCTDGTTHKPSGLSKIAYVELIKDSLESVIKEVIPLHNGAGSGSFYLPTTLKSGNYTLRAYTRWMRNFDEAFFFHRTITVINPFRRLGLTRHKKAILSDLAFYPEGGNLLVGQKGMVAFKGTDQYGKGMVFKGWLTDHEGNKVLEFRPLHAGIGTFTFTPVRNASYIAHVTGPDSIQRDFILPDARSQGLTLHVESGENQIRIEITASPEAGKTAKLFVHTRNRIQAFSELDMSRGSAVFTLDKAKLNPGITHITIFDARGNPACERLVFIRPGELMNIQITPEKGTYKTRENVRLRINTVLSGIPAGRELSVSVFRYDKLYPDDGNNMVNYLYLNSEVKGRIEDPGYYFGDTREATSAVDHLMLTHGWRRFNWDEILRARSKAPRVIPEYRNMIISGTLTDKATGHPVNDTLVYLSSPGKFLQTYVSKTDSTGKVYFELRNLFGNRQILLQTQYKPADGYTLHLDPVFSNTPIRFPPAEAEINPEWESLIRQLSISMQVKNAYIENLPKQSATLPDTSLFYGEPDERYYLDDFTRFPVMEEVMREYVHGVLVRRHRGHFQFKVIDPENDNIFSKSPFILLDGVPVFQTDMIMEYDPKKVERIDVLTRKYILGEKVSHGIVSYTTYEGNLAGFDISDADLVMFIDGLQSKRTFYSPHYDSPGTLVSRIPDYRNLLYWNPDLTIDRNGISLVEFFSSDEPGTYKIVVEGITPEGIPGYAETFIEIAPGPEQK